MARGKQNTKKEPTPKKTCLKCGKTKAAVSSNFYKHAENQFKPLDGLHQICCACIDEQIDESNFETIYEVLKHLDRPFLPDRWKSSIEESKNRKANGSNGWGVWKCYMKNISMKEVIGLTWKDSTVGGNLPIENKKATVHINKKESSNDIEEELFGELLENEFKIDAEIIKRWGKSYSIEDYMQLEDFYIKMKDSNKIETHQDETYLKKLSIISLKMDKELEAGNYGQVKQLGDLFSKYMADSKFRAMDQTDASKTGGIRTFSQIYTEVEKDDFIPPWEQFRKIKGLEQDILDKTIMHIENYTLKLNKMPQMISPPDDTPKIDKDIRVVGDTNE